MMREICPDREIALRRGDEFKAIMRHGLDETAKLVILTTIYFLNTYLTSYFVVTHGF
jgi:hypothetical protein